MLAEIDEQSIALSYSSLDRSLSWQDADGETIKIDHDAILGIISTEGTHVLHYVVNSDNEVVVKSIKVDEPATSLLNELSPPASSFLQGLRSRPDSRPLHVIVSIGSGTGKAKAFNEQALLPLLKELNVDHMVHLTTSESFVKDFTVNTILPSANAGHKETIVILSGDGGLVDILNAIKTSKLSSTYVPPSVGIIPLGTGNALANSTGVLNDKTLGLKTLLWGVPKPLSAFKVTFSDGTRALIDEGRKEEALPVIDGKPTAYGCVVCSWGLHAALVADSDTVEYRKFGAERFKMAAKENLFPPDGAPPHAYKGAISYVRTGANKEDWQFIPRSEHGYVLSTPVSHLEAGFNISPASKSLDGVLRLLHFEPLSGHEAVDIMGKAYQGGKHIDDERVSYVPICAMRIDFHEDDAQWRRVCIDGKIIRVDKDGYLEVMCPVPADVDLVTMI